MKSCRASTALFGLFLITLIVVASTPPLFGQEQILFPFAVASTQAVSNASPAIDSHGNLYLIANVTVESGLSSMLELSPPVKRGAQWSLSSSTNITGLVSAGLAVDHAGNLYGTASGGTYGFGYVFELVPQCCGQWTQNVLYNFRSATLPVSNFVLDAAGNLYASNQSCGSIFKLLHPTSSNSSWAEQVLYYFQNSADGCNPTPVVLDTHGNIYAQTLFGGTNKTGAIIKLSPPGNAGGKWAEQNIFEMPAVPPYGLDVAPGNTLALDVTGNLFGIQSFGGTASSGSVFELSPSSNGSWNFSVLYSFTGNVAGSSDGAYPGSGLVIGKNGILYGTTTQGGPANLYSGYLGTVYQLTPPTVSGGTWTETILHNFTGGYDGWYPDSTPVLASDGAIYGTTATGGNNNSPCFPIFYDTTGCGTVFRLVP